MYGAEVPMFLPGMEQLRSRQAISLTPGELHRFLNGQLVVQEVNGEACCEYVGGVRTIVLSNGLLEVQLFWNAIATHPGSPDSEWILSTRRPPVIPLAYWWCQDIDVRLWFNNPTLGETWIFHPPGDHRVDPSSVRAA